MPAPKPASRSRKAAKPTGKARPSKGKAAPAKGARKRAQPAPAPPAPSWWDQLSAERKLDILGILLAFIGLVIILSLISVNRSLFLGGLIQLLGQIFGWGVYILPIGLVVMGMWLVFRKIERIPPVSVERLTGISLLFLWLLTFLHTLVAAPETAETIALTGVGGGSLGGLFQRALWFGLGAGGALIAMLAWLIIGLSLMLDISVQDLFRWSGPVISRLRQQLTRRLAAIFAPSNSPAKPFGPRSNRPSSAAQGGPAAVATNGYTPLKTAAAPMPAIAPNLSTTTTPSSPTVIHWALPAVHDILDAGSAPAVNEDFIQQRARLIEDTLASFGAPAQVVEISRGPTITQFGVEPLFVESRGGRTRVRVSKIASLSDDLALALAAPRIRIQAPVPGHGYVGIEVPNEEMMLVALRDIVDSEIFQRNKKPLSFALGRDVAGHPMLANLESMPHLLIAGTTGSGKSVCVNAILTSMLLHNTPDDLRLVLVDPKRVELTNYNGIPHLLGPVVVEMERVVGALQWMTREMDKRYHTFAQVGARNITDYNARMKMQGGKRLPMLVIIIDELADLMMIAPDETERTITRLAQLARATGI
ncbi:MAG: hypothetical protein A2Z03_11665, partial [Chloroflexi bacterium RBG_16_56_8]